MYHAVLMFGVNEVVPRTTFEIAFVSFVMLVSSMVNANIFGIMAVLVSEMNRKSVHFQEQIDTANTAMDNLKLPNETKRVVKDYLISVQGTQDQ